ncbi:hypothetical protein K32_32340 [Kaistia sp. 32K]|uniref:hypothetical protein n=1 Tax=Kaistia sp. 32K TaxID=2795690 RepID=UPI001915FC5B|nr:hypothetical protein [Kaistia sp. 32K]BCP54617.1 hypothetical protein K32_32340 [Kaistia sp. 32K]
MALIDDYLPAYQFSERHSRPIAAAPERVMAAVAAYRPDNDRFFAAMIGLRELPMRLSARLSGRPATLAAPFGLANFTRLDERRASEMVYGLVGRFWRRDFGLVAIPDGAAFRAFNEPGVAKLVVGFAAKRTEAGTLLATETRVHCPDRAALRRFAPYWYLIRPVSGLIRQRMLAAVQRACERPDPGQD